MEIGDEEVDKAGEKTDMMEETEEDTQASASQYARKLAEKDHTIAELMMRMQQMEAAMLALSQNGGHNAAQVGPQDKRGAEVRADAGLASLPLASAQGGHAPTGRGGEAAAGSDLRPP